MSGLAEILLTMGCRVTGSDTKPSPIISRLRRRGAKITLKHQMANVGETQVVVTSTAIARSNVEVAEAVRRGIPVIARAELLAELMRVKYGIAISGSHGKTTTTSLVAAILTEGGLDPTAVIGGRVNHLRTNAKLGKGDFLVTEADESDGSFLHLSPTWAVITNVDAEHLDHYRDFETLQKTFEEFASKVPFYGAAVLCRDDPFLARLIGRLGKRVLSYGLEGGADFSASSIRSLGFSSEFQVKYRGAALGTVRVNLPGRHNVQNSLAAIAIGHELGVKFSDMKRALSRFQGVGRRLEILCDGAVRVVDDYGHHPTEIKATLAALRSVWKKERLWVLFQPHRYTRTKLLFQEFCRAFTVRPPVDRLLIAPIYPAGEEPIQGVSHERLVAAMGKKLRVQAVNSLWDLPDLVIPQLKKGDLVLTLGAGDITKVGHEIARRLKE